MFSTDVQAEWNWIFLERHTRINGEVLIDWKEVAIFADKVACKDHVEAVINLLSERFKKRNNGRDAVVQINTDRGEDFGELVGVGSNEGDQPSFIQYKCLQKQIAYMMKSSLTGNNYRLLTPIEKRRYVRGILDGTFTAPGFGAPRENMEWIEKCITNMTVEQPVAILEKYMADNPERWGDPMNFIFLSAMNGVCRPQKKQK